MTRYYKDETGMYIDWDQLERLPEIDTLIDIGVGPMGTPTLYSRFDSAKLLLIDPLDETKSYIDKNLLKREVMWHQCGVGKEADEAMINVEDKIGRSSILNVADIHYEGAPIDNRKIQIKTLDSVTASEKNFGTLDQKIGAVSNIIKYFE